MSEQQLEKVRIDKWLWAARFYKTRSLAKSAVEGGKVHFEGHRVKASKEVQLGANIRVRQGFDDRDVVVTGLSEKRGSAKDAAALYEETETSLQRRADAAANRKALRLSEPKPISKPTKKERRQLKQLHDPFSTND